MLERSQPRSLRACSRDDPECGARRGVLRRRLVTVRPGRCGTPPSRHYDLAARSSLCGSCVMRETEARGPSAQNRHGGAPRGERPASWDARRLARRLAYRVMIRPTGVPLSTRTFLGAPPTPRFGVSEAKLQTPGAKRAAGTREAVVMAKWDHKRGSSPRKRTHDNRR